MTTINSNGPSPATSQIQSQKASVDARKRLQEPTAPLESPAATVSSDELALSSGVETALETAEFDSARVEQLRQAIAEGAYPLDAMKISEQFIELEKLI
jgi:negative regulator of flagellin synthesis FlgM